MKKYLVEYENFAATNYKEKYNRKIFTEQEKNAFIDRVEKYFFDIYITLIIELPEE
jgi:hypothetical protein